MLVLIPSTYFWLRWVYLFNLTLLVLLPRLGENHPNSKQFAPKRDCSPLKGLTSLTRQGKGGVVPPTIHQATFFSCYCYLCAFVPAPHAWIFFATASQPRRFFSFISAFRIPTACAWRSRSSRFSSCLVSRAASSVRAVRRLEWTRASDSVACTCSIGSWRIHASQNELATAVGIHRKGVI